MLAVRKTEAAFGVEMLEVSPPEIRKPDDVLIDVVAAGICGSDIHALEWTRGYEFMVPHLPLTLGHEFAGIVAAVGTGVTRFKQGDHVTVWPVIGCGECFACRDDRRQDCSCRHAIGLHWDGAFSDRVVVPEESCFRLPDDLDLDIGALTEPFCVALNAIDIAEFRLGDSVVVLGPGPIGLAIAWLAQRTGARTILAGFDDDVRLRTGRQIGLTHLVDLREETLQDAVQRIVGRPVDRVIEASGAIQSVHDGLAILRSSGIFTVVGIHSRNLEIDLTGFVRGKKQLRAAHDSPRYAWEKVISLLAEHGDELRPMISHTLPMDRALEGFELARRKQAVKVILRPPASTPPPMKG